MENNTAYTMTETDSGLLFKARTKNEDGQISEKEICIIPETGRILWICGKEDVPDSLMKEIEKSAEEIRSVYLAEWERNTVLEKCRYLFAHLSPSDIIWLTKHYKTDNEMVAYLEDRYIYNGDW